MPKTMADLGVEEHQLAHQVELLVVDLSRARAFYEGVPSARLLARVQLSREGDLASWDALLSRLVGGDHASLERMRRAIITHVRAAADEGPLVAPDGVVAALVVAVNRESGDASLGETFASTRPGKRADHAYDACALYDPRLGESGVDLRIPMFEACVRLAAVASAGPWPSIRFAEAASQVGDTELGGTWAREEESRFFPYGIDSSGGGAKMSRIAREPLDALVARDPHELASAIGRADRAHGRTYGATSGTKGGLDKFIADLAHLLTRSGALVVAATLPDPDADGPTVESHHPSERPSSIPLDWSLPDVAVQLADQFERGQINVSRVRNMVSRGGEPALDAIGAEMLRVPLHISASAAYAEILARSGRPRDVIRLVTYFAITPDPDGAARSLNACGAPELPAVLRAWLEAMLPADGTTAPLGDDPSTSSAARLQACVSSLAPYPHLYAAVRPLLVRVSEAPAPASG
ncbi:MAG: hypothetical protein ACRELY_19475 [Polyangiaceae bacterium]